MRNRQLLVKSWPEGLPKPENFELADGPMPVPGDAQVLIRNLWLSIDHTTAIRSARASWEQNSAGQAT